MWNKVREVKGEQFMCLNHSVMVSVSFVVFKISLWQSGDTTQAAWAPLDSSWRAVEIT